MKNHRTAEALVSRSLDDDLRAGERNQLQAALEENPELQTLAEDLALLKVLAPELDPPGPPPESRALRARVELRYAAPAGRKRLVTGYRGLIWTASILAFLMLLPWVRQGFRENQPALQKNPLHQGETSSLNPPAMPLTLVQAQVQFHRQAATLENLVLRRLTLSNDPGAVTWARDFYKLNRAIAQLEELCRRYPSRPGHYAALGRVYHAKIDLLAAFLTASEEVG